MDPMLKQWANTSRIRGVFPIGGRAPLGNERFFAVLRMMRTGYRLFECLAGRGVWCGCTVPQLASVGAVGGWPGDRHTCSVGPFITLVTRSARMSCRLPYNSVHE